MKMMIKNIVFVKKNMKARNFIFAVINVMIGFMVAVLASPVFVPIKLTNIFVHVVKVKNQEAIEIFNHLLMVIFNGWKK